MFGSLWVIAIVLCRVFVACRRRLQETTKAGEKYLVCRRPIIKILIP